MHLPPKKQILLLTPKPSASCLYILEPPAVPPDLDNPIVLPTDNSVSINMRKVYLPLLMTIMFFSKCVYDLG
jgi:hypothetical protein